MLRSVTYQVPLCADTLAYLYRLDYSPVRQWRIQLAFRILLEQKYGAPYAAGVGAPCAGVGT